VHYDLDVGWHTVTVHYLDLNGNEIGTPSSMLYAIEEGQTFKLADEGGIPTIKSHAYEDWRVGLDGALQGGTTAVEVASVEAATDIYLIYSYRPTLTLSHSVSGPYSDSSKEFVYTVYFTDRDDEPLASGTELNYLGSSLPHTSTTAPADGILKLDDEGSATIKLKHGQAITVQDIMQSYKVRIVMEEDTNYATAFFDDALSDPAPEDGCDTGGTTGEFRALDGDRTFDFLSLRKEVAESGVEVKAFELLLLVPLSFAVSTFLFLVTRMLYRARKGEGVST